MNYSFKEKMHHYNDLLSEQHVEVDMALLKAKNPTCYVVESNFTGRKLAEEVLYNLLDVVSREDIIENRRKQTKPSIEEKMAVSRISEIIREMRSVSYTDAAILKTEAQQLLVAFLPAEKAEKWAAALDKAMPVLDDDSDSDKGNGSASNEGINLNNTNAPAPADILSGEGNLPPVVAASEAAPDPNAGTDAKKKEKPQKQNTPKKRNTR